jgi:hypothetical protein
MTFSPLVIIGISISIVISVLFYFLPYNINEAEILAVRLETFKQADNHRGKMLGIACNYRQIQKCRYGKGY